MLEVTVADPIDPFRHFLANGYYSLGLSRMAEMLEIVDPDQANKLKTDSS